MTSEKITSIWFVFVGISITSLWIILFLTSSVNESHISFILHLSAEGITAFFGLYVGLTHLLGGKVIRPTMFFTLGLILASSAGAGGYYLAEMGDIGFFLLLETIALITMTLFIILYKNESIQLAVISIGSTQMDSRLSKLINFSIGLAVYVSLNSATYFGESGNWFMVLVHIVTTLSLLYIHLVSIRGKNILSTQDSIQKL
ncbi:MAG: hypothetical protein ACFFED_02410 [Candidatus Thorarchaeota archaeon]